LEAVELRRDLLDLLRLIGWCDLDTLGIPETAKLEAAFECCRISLTT